MYQKNAVLVVLFGTMVAFLSSCGGPQMIPVTYHPPTDVYDGWRLGTQAYTFRKFTFYEAVDKTALLGLGWIEAYPGQKLSKEKPNVKFNHTMPPQIREEVKEAGQLRRGEAAK